MENRKSAIGNRFGGTSKPPKTALRRQTAQNTRCKRFFAFFPLPLPLPFPPSSGLKMDCRPNRAANPCGAMDKKATAPNKPSAERRLRQGITCIGNYAFSGAPNKPSAERRLRHPVWEYQLCELVVGPPTNHQPKGD